MKSKIPEWLSHTLRVSFAVIVIALLIRSGALKPALLGAAIAQHPALYGFAFFLYLVPLQFLAWGRWHLLLRAAKVNISWRESARLHLTGIFFNGFLPGGTGGDLVKGWYLLKGRSRTESAAALGTLVVDRITGLFGLIGLAAAANWISRDVWSASPLLAAQSAFILSMAAAVTALTVIFLSPWKPQWITNWRFLGHKPKVQAAATPGLHEVSEILEESQTGRGFLAEFAVALGSFHKYPRVFLGAIGISMVVHLILISVYALCAAALNVDLPFRLHAYVAPTLTFANGMPISPAGLGVGEAAGMVLYKAVGASHGFAEIPALVHTIGLIVAIVFAPAYLLRKR
jgi:uncharacterized protein (TIRG00374 family)